MTGDEHGTCFLSVNVLRAGIQIKERPGTIIGSSPHPCRPAGGSARQTEFFLLEVRDLWPRLLSIWARLRIVV